MALAREMPEIPRLEGEPLPDMVCPHCGASSVEGKIEPGRWFAMECQTCRVCWRNTEPSIVERLLVAMAD
jgi:hypothetical protein